ncbi:MAG: hypothetical protein A3G18_01710 [Rhodospirillales bacterium RIFCSPLOWO2_12_FULL_58_28]|nr:MAG: hypothetical protein A3H92_07805 [Rhodospirillales bacterium RIFCSPLOWO2_02_FULL_58_16]OHC79013.1 MAG: hypothetical protein A3G18_01710 [Rhodospirillales bacterium RIFCSPLOWO2_12_FULL_58_28]
MEKKAFIALVVAASLATIGIMIVLTGKPAVEPRQMVIEPQQDAGQQASTLSGNVHIENERQTIEMNVNGNYSPQLTIAKANMPTVLKIITKNAFGCSNVLVIPGLDYRVRLPLNGVTEVEAPPQQLNSELTGQCSMGMYGFKIRFIMP